MDILHSTFAAGFMGKKVCRQCSQKEEKEHNLSKYILNTMGKQTSCVVLGEPQTLILDFLFDDGMTLLSLSVFVV